MDAHFEVPWRRRWRKSATLASVIPLGIASIGLVLVIMEKGAAETVHRLVTPGVIIAILAPIIFINLIMLLIALIERSMAIRLTDNFIEGRNFWGQKKQIPLSDITRLSPSNTAIILTSSQHGKIYISNYTENLPKLIALLQTHLMTQQTF